MRPSKFLISASLLLICSVAQAQWNTQGAFRVLNDGITECAGYKIYASNSTVTTGPGDGVCYIDVLASAETVYLRLDATNDPVTGALELEQDLDVGSAVTTVTTNDLIDIESSLTSTSNNTWTNLNFGGDVTYSAGSLINSYYGIFADPDMTYDTSVFGTWGMFAARPVLTANAASVVLPPPLFFWANPTIQTASNVAAGNVGTPGVGVLIDPLLRSQGASGDITFPQWVSFKSDGQLSTTAAGGTATVTDFTHFEAVNVATSGGGTETLTTQYGVNIADLNSGASDYGIWLSGADDGAIVLDDDGQGGRIYFGEGQDATVDYDGTNLVVDPDTVGSGVVNVTGNLTVANNPPIVTLEDTGGTIDWTMTVDNGDLTFTPSSASGTTNFEINAPINIYPDITTELSGGGVVSTFRWTGSQTYTGTTDWPGYMYDASSVTINNPVGVTHAIWAAPTHTYTSTLHFGAYVFFNASATNVCATVGGDFPNTPTIFNDAMTWRASNVAMNTGNQQVYVSFAAQPTWDTDGASGKNRVSSFTGFGSAPNFSTDDASGGGQFQNVTHFSATGIVPSGAGAANVDMDNQYGLNIQGFTHDWDETQIGILIGAISGSAPAQAVIATYGASGAGTNYGITIQADGSPTNGGAGYWLGAGLDAQIYYDGTDLVVNAQEVGTGDVLFPNDNQALALGAGTGGDSRIYYNATDLIIDPDAVGTGIVLIGATGDDDMRLNDIEIDGDLNHDGTNIGFYGVAPVARPAAYTQTYSTATRTHAARTAPGAGAGSGADGTTFSGAECDALVADQQNTAQILNQLIDDLQANGVLQ